MSYNNDPRSGMASGGSYAPVVTAAQQLGSGSLGQIVKDPSWQLHGLNQTLEARLKALNEMTARIGAIGDRLLGQRPPSSDKISDAMPQPLSSLHRLSKNLDEFDRLLSVADQEIGRIEII